MKKIIVVGFIFSFLMSFSQVRSIRQAQVFEGPIPSGSISHWTRVDYAKFVVPKKSNDVKGNKYAFKQWTNRGVLAVDGNNYKFNDINFNMRTNTIETQVGKDSVYIFDLNNVDHAYINNRKFKSYYSPKKKNNEIFELLFEGDNFEFIKSYEVGIKRPVVDPAMVTKPIAKYYTTERFYIKRLNNIEEISLKKKNIMPLFKNKKDKMLAYIKNNSLSFRKEDQVSKMFNYYHGLQ